VLNSPAGTELDRLQVIVHTNIVPHADRWDQEAIPADLINELSSHGYFGAAIPKDHGGSGMDTITFGLLHEAIGYGCSSVRSVLTVHSMVAHAITRWGTQCQRAAWLPRLAVGECVGAFALTEAQAGSDAGHLQTIAERCDNSYRLYGRKRWITYGQRADLFLVFARCEESYRHFWWNGTPRVSRRFPYVGFSEPKLRCWRNCGCLGAEYPPVPW
jgi:glutaryl-CoA dehydrogenase (non-decarboxylating)